jgi:ribosomal protein L37E
VSGDGPTTVPPGGDPPADAPTTPATPAAETPAPAPATSAPTSAPIRCPRCGARVASEQDWCLECGAPARTRLAPTPNWRLPIAAVVAVVLAAGIALAVAFVALTNDGTQVAATTAAPAPVQPNETAAPQSVTTPPPATVTTPAPAATTTTPAATTPATPGTTPTTPGG